MKAWLERSLANSSYRELRSGVQPQQDIPHPL